MPVSLRRDNCVATVCASQSGVFEWSGDPTTGSTTLAYLAATTMHDKGWAQGRFLHDELFVVRRVAKALGRCTIIDADITVKTLREGWIQLLRDHLTPDPGAAALGQHLDDLRTGDGIGCRIEARGAKLLPANGPAHTRCWPASGGLNVGDLQYLRFASRIRKTGQGLSCPVRSIMWERIVCVHFFHCKPTTEFMIESRAKIHELLAERELRTERSRQRLLRRG
jgi:hypothetical protein